MSAAPYGWGPTVPEPPGPPRHPSARTAFIAGIAGLAGVLLCGVGVVVSPVAWWLGRVSVREIDANPDDWSGREMAERGRVLGMIGTVTLVLVVTFWVLLVAQINQG